MTSIVSLPRSVAAEWGVGGVRSSWPDARDTLRAPRAMGRRTMNPRHLLRVITNRTGRITRQGASRRGGGRFRPAIDLLDARTLMVGDVPAVPSNGVSTALDSQARARRLWPPRSRPVGVLRRPGGRAARNPPEDRCP